MISASKLVAILVLLLVATSICCRGDVLKDLLRVKVNAEVEVSKQNHELLINYENFDYYGKLFVGSPGQLLFTKFDTQDSKSWILSKNNSDFCMWSHKSFDNSKSKTYNNKAGKNANIGLMSGNWVSDTIEISGIKIENQSFVEINDTPQQSICSMYYDATIGLGLSANGEGNSVLRNMIERKLISKAMFSIYYARDLRREPGGEIIFGGYDEKYFTGDINYFDISDKNSWQIKLDSITLKGDSEFSLCEGGCQASVSSNELFVRGPKEQIQKINKALGAKKKFDFSNDYEFDDCRNLPTLPEVEINIGNKKLTLTPEQYVYFVPGGTSCLSLFGDGNQDKWVLSNLFISAYYTIFDYENSRIGFAKVRV